MFAKLSDKVKPSIDGLQSLVERQAMLPYTAARLMAANIVQEKLDPAVYQVIGVTDGADHSWVTVVAKWDGKPLKGDPSEEVAKAVAPLACRFSGIDSNLMFSWSIEMPAVEPEKPAARSGRPAKPE
jgi:hypothetical protein